MPTYVSGPCGSSVIIVAKSIVRSLREPRARRQTRRVLFADLVATSAAVTSTSARSAKIAALADLLSRLDDDEVHIAVAMLTGRAAAGAHRRRVADRVQPRCSGRCDAVAHHPGHRRARRPVGDHVRHRLGRSP